MMKIKILEYSTYLFAQQGYYSVSLSEITNPIGIKKPSIYHYFQSKEDLLLQCIDKAVEKEISFLQKEIKREHMNIENCFKSLSLSLRTRYLKYDTLKLIFTILIDLPSHLKFRMRQHTQPYFTFLERTIQQKLEENGWCIPLSGVVTSALITFLNGICTNLLAKEEKSFNLRWHIFWSGVSKLSSNLNLDLNY
ncbi:TetR/AcrR family transcriptional regulator [Priestia megaterium]|uniref:TetR/AcrR family transcriptional regulator n=1 Tax=Priestia megaterium TaxID=1404 RepID=UPI0015D4F7D5|nr:TetR/AcrR family transcriptional regulator [Priestia megaterium]